MTCIADKLTIFMFRKNLLTKERLMKKYTVLLLAVLVAFACSQKKEEKAEETKAVPKAAVEEPVMPALRQATRLY